jgi:hypothetical protein
MSWSHAWRAGILAGLLAVGSSGCGAGSDNLPREALTGLVTIDGQPLARGTIQFAPTSDKLPTTGTSGIVEGKYFIARSEGLVPGEYKVAIISLTEVAESKSLHGLPGKPAPPPKNLISKQFNRESSLTREVKGGDTNRFNFDVKKADSKEEAESSGNIRSRRRR